MDSWHELEAKFDEGEKVDLSFLGIPNKDEDEEEEARYTLIGSSFSTFTRTCRIALMAKNAVFDQVSTLPHSSTALSFNPLGFIPVLIDMETDVQLTESLAILHYIQRIHPNQGPNLFEPKVEVSLFSSGDFDPLPEHIYEVIGFVCNHVYPKVEFGLVKPRLSAQEAKKLTESEISSSLKPALNSLKPILKILETFLTLADPDPTGDSEIYRGEPLGPYCFGPALTAADCYLYPVLADLKAIPEGEVLKGYVRINAWLEFFSDTPEALATKEGTLENGDKAVELQKS